MNRVSNRVDDIAIVPKQVKGGADSEVGYNRVKRDGQSGSSPPYALGAMLSSPSV